VERDPRGHPPPQGTPLKDTAQVSIRQATETQRLLQPVPPHKERQPMTITECKARFELALKHYFKEKDLLHIVKDDDITETTLKHISKCFSQYRNLEAKYLVLMVNEIEKQLHDRKKDNQ
jgi:hypothetical protein